MVGAQHIVERQGCIQKVPNRHSRMLSEKRPLRGDAVHMGCRSRCSKFGACELRGGEYLDPPSAQCPFPTRRQGWGLQRTPRDSPLPPESRVWCSYWHPPFPIGRPWLDQNAPIPGHSGRVSSGCHTQSELGSKEMYFLGFLGIQRAIPAPGLGWAGV